MLSASLWLSETSLLPCFCSHRQGRENLGLNNSSAEDARSRVAQHPLRFVKRPNNAKYHPEFGPSNHHSGPNRRFPPVRSTKQFHVPLKRVTAFLTMISDAPQITDLIVW